MLSFTTSKEVAAQFVNDLLLTSPDVFPSITITPIYTSVGYYALTVTNMSSDDIVEKLGRSYLKQLMSI